MSSASLFRWTGHALVEVDEHEATRSGTESVLDAADSLLVSDRRAFALELHRARFHDAVSTRSIGETLFPPREIDAFWSAAFAMIPPSGNWFPRLELRSNAGGSHLAYRHRLAPDLTRSVTLISHSGQDPRRVPSVKGPDIEALGAAQARARQHGADDAVLATSGGHIIDGATNALVWWRGETLCAPPSAEDDPAFARVPSVTATSLLGLASALGLETRAELATPADLDGSEVWALNALHGIRIVTGWVNGPTLAERPGRIGAWRERREALRAPIGGM